MVNVVLGSIAIAGLFLATLFVGLSHTGSWDASLLRPVPERGVKPDSIGWAVHRVPRAGVTISMPRGWQTVGRNPVSHKAIVRLRKENPELAAYFSDAVFRNPAVKLRAFDTRPEAIATAKDKHFVSGMNLVQGPSAATRVQTWARDMREVRAIPTRVGRVRESRLATNAGKALEVRYGMSVKSPAGSRVALALTQYSVVSGAKEFVLTYVTTADQAAAYAPLFRKSARSFSLR